MEILISTLIGIVLVEAYAWLDPLARWLVRRAGQQLPEESREELTEQFLADVDALPNSVFKVVFAFRNCTMAINDINEAVYRDTFESIVDGYDSFIDRMMSKRDRIVAQSKDIVQCGETSGGQLISTLNSCLGRLEKLDQGRHAVSAIEHARELSPLVAQHVSDYNSRLAQRHDLISRFDANLRTALTRLSNAQSEIKRRLRDDTRIGENDIELLETLLDRLTAVSGVLDVLKEDRLYDFDPPKDMLPAVKAASEAIKVAAHTIKEARSAH